MNIKKYYKKVKKDIEERRIECVKIDYEMEIAGNKLEVLISLESSLEDASINPMKVVSGSSLPQTMKDDLCTLALDIAKIIISGRVKQSVVDRLEIELYNTRKILA